VLSSETPADPALFGAAAGLVRSQALLRISISRSGPTGLLCIGTRNPDTFHPGLGTELLTFLARALEITIAQWLEPGREPQTRPGSLDCRDPRRRGGSRP